MPDPTFPLGQGGPGVFVVTPQWRPGHGEQAQPSAGSGDQGVGSQGFTQSHIIHWELRRQGSPGPLPSMKANQAVKGDASSCWPCPRSHLPSFLPGEALARVFPDSWRPSPPFRGSLGCGGSHRQAWESFGDR